MVKKNEIAQTLRECLYEPPEEKSQLWRHSPKVMGMSREGSREGRLGYVRLGIWLSPNWLIYTGKPSNVPSICIWWEYTQTSWNIGDQRESSVHPVIGSPAKPGWAGMPWNLSKTTLNALKSPKIKVISLFYMQLVILGFNLTYQPGQPGSTTYHLNFEYSTIRLLAMCLAMVAVLIVNSIHVGRMVHSPKTRSLRWL